LALAHSLLSGDLITRRSDDQQHLALRADLLHEALGPSLLLSPQGELIDSNEASCLLWDSGPAQAALIKLVRHVAANGTPAILDISTDTHPVRRFHMRALLLSGEAKRIWCSGTEMSVQDHLIEALKESRALFRDLADAAGDFCAEVDPNGVICYVSTAGALGHDAWQLNGRHINCLGPEAQCLVSRRPIGPMDIQAIDTDGQPRFLSVVGAPVFRNKIWTGTRLMARDVTDERAMAQAMRAAHAEQLKTLERLSRTDELTGLANRRAFEEEVQRRVASLERHDGAGSLMLLDLDHFKTINDTLGHAAGDSALRALAAKLHELKRETDLVARIGGDEFAVWLDGCSALGAQRVAAKIVAAMTGIRQMFGGGLVELSVSIGIAEWHRGAEDMQLLLRRADDALYEVKRAGRGAYQLWVEA
jgi:diguanylate cyclase (GGDEF)-like protein/PAS domain S-box-containing protein